MGGYKKIERSVVGAYQDVEDKFVGRFLTHEGETVEEAKARLQQSRPFVRNKARQMPQSAWLNKKRESNLASTAASRNRL